MFKRLSVPRSLGRFSFLNLSIKAKILMLVAVPLIMIAGIGAIASIQLQKLAHTQSWVEF